MSTDFLVTTGIHDGDSHHRLRGVSVTLQPIGAEMDYVVGRPPSYAVEPGRGGDFGFMSPLLSAVCEYEIRSEATSRR